jgi:EF-P beta-lysylation protein EpmB
MYQANDSPLKTPDWQQELALAITNPADLVAALGLPREWLDAVESASKLFRLKVTRHYLGLIKHNEPNDPLLLQVMPGIQEHKVVDGFSTDPVEDKRAMVLPGLLQKYHGRALLTVTGACAVHCRYCFRRHYAYADANPLNQHWHRVLEYLASTRDIHEIILSGGDPLALSDEKLATILQDLQKIPHLHRIRIHSRLISVLPMRLTKDLLRLLSQTGKQVVVVTHINHTAEIDPVVHDTLTRLQHAGLTLLNQSVLLRRVNDDADTLVSLSERLFAAGVLPYYLHMLDPVQGAAHFAVGPERARLLAEQVASRLPGYLVPRLVREQADAGYKLPLA